jgi:hypothetical protein
MFPLYDDEQPTAATWTGDNNPTQSKKLSLRDEVGILKSAREAEVLKLEIKKIIQLLKDREWAEHISTHPLIQELELEISKLINKHHDATS